jgi:hypothetical protein
MGGSRVVGPSEDDDAASADLGSKVGRILPGRREQSGPADGPSLNKEKGAQMQIDRAMKRRR